MQTRRIHWNDKLTTDLLSVDHQHQDLIDQFNAFVTAFEDEKPVSELCGLFTDIIGHVQEHFRFEERIMDNIGYRGYVEHKKHHDMLCADAGEVLEELKSCENPKDALPSISFLRALIMKHMVEQDLKIRQHINRGLPEN